MQLLTIIAVGTLLTAVTAQTGQPIVDRTQYYVGETFNITCDITKFSGVPTAPYLSKLSLMRQPLTETKFTEIAIYQPFLPNPNDQNVTTLPSGRQWIVQYSGGVSQTNRQTIKIVTTVVGLRCDDAGLYKCYLELPRYPSNDSTIANLTVKAQITQDDLSVSPKNGDDPYFSSYRLEENNNITISMSCTFRGPGNLKAVWKWKPQDSNEENYPTQNEIVDERPVTSTSAGCTSSSYRSTLSFQLQPDNNGAIYYCTVEENNVEMSRANFTIDIEPTNPSQQTASAGGPDVGAIVGGVIGGVVFLIIVIVLIYFFVIRKKRQGGDEEEKRKDVETTDSGKDNNFTPPPVFYSKPHKPPKDERDGSKPVGMTNEGLDTSYDSKDLKGPPQYSNAVDDYEPPHYEKETHRGRANKGYEEEKEDKTGGHGRRRHRDREDKDSEDRGERRERSRHRDRDAEPRGRHYSTEDNTDYRYDPNFGDPNMGTSI